MSSTVAADFTIVARMNDAFPLVEDRGRQDGDNEKVRVQATSALKALSEQYRSQSHDAELQSIIINGSFDTKFYVTMGCNLMVLAAFGAKEHPSIALGFASQVRALVVEEIKKDNGVTSLTGSEMGRLLDNITIAYHYISLDRAIRRRRQGLMERNDRDDGLKRLNNSLEEVATLMQRNMNDLLLRGENLESVSSKADQLKESSKKFGKQARNLNSGLWLRTYGPIIGVGSLFVIFVLFIVLR